MSLRDYQKEQKLGEGTYSTSFRAKHIPTGEEVILKHIRMDQEEDGIPASSIRELSLLRHIHHANFIELRDVIYENGCITMIQEKLQMTLSQYLSRKKVSNDLIKSYSLQLLAAVLLLHKMGIIHRDLKPDKLLIDRKGFLKVFDLRSSINAFNEVKNSYEQMKIQWYVAPERLLDFPSYNKSVDIWSCGCIIAEMACHKNLFEGDSKVDQINKICSVLGVPSKEEFPKFYNEDDQTPLCIPATSTPTIDKDLEGVDPLLADLIKKMLVMNPDKRITAYDAIHHDYFKNMITKATPFLQDPVF